MNIMIVYILGENRKLKSIIKYAPCCFVLNVELVLHTFLFSLGFTQ